MTDQDFNVWEGVYEDWSQAPMDDAVFSSNIWVEKVVERATKTLESYQELGGPPPVSFIHETALPLASAMIFLDDQEPLRILDFGGGMGSSYLPLRANLPDRKLIEFHIVEAEAVCQRARELFSSYPDLHFHQTLPALPDPVHITHLGSSLQYIDDWAGLISSFASLKPRYLILTDVFAGDIESFVTIQKFHEKKIRVRFHNLREFLYTIEQLGFHLIFISNYYTTIFGKVGPLPMKNFDKKFQLDHACQLIFKWVG
jgi:putative methyltransferase (TIGR04325 family)